MAKAKTKSRINLGYGAVYQRKTKQGRVRWYLDYFDQKGKRIQRVSKNAQSSDEAAMELRLEVGRVFRAEQGLTPEKEPLTFNELADMYLRDYARANKRSWMTDEYRLRALHKYFDDFLLPEITPQTIERFRSERLRSGEASSTVNRRMALLKRMLNLAIDWGYLSKNPVCKVRFFSEKENERVRVLTEDEESRLLRCCPDYLRTILLVALHTGMRRGEILNMKWSEVDFSTNDIRIPHSKGGRPRFIPVNQTLKGILLGLQENNPKGVQIFPYKNIRMDFERACRQAELVDFSFHDLRRTFGTRLLERGVNIVTISRYYGHSSVLVTQRYLHPRDELNREAVERLNTAPKSVPLKSQNPLRPCDIAEGPSALGPLTPTNTAN